MIKAIVFLDGSGAESNVQKIIGCDGKPEQVVALGLGSGQRLSALFDHGWRIHSIGAIGTGGSGAIVLEHD